MLSHGNFLLAGRENSRYRWYLYHNLASLLESLIHSGIPPHGIPQCRMLLCIPSRCWPLAPHAATHLAWHCQTLFFWTFLLSLYSLIETASMVFFCQNSPSLTSLSVCSLATFPIHEYFKHGLCSSHMEHPLCSQLWESILISEMLPPAIGRPTPNSILSRRQTTQTHFMANSLSLPWFLDSISYAGSGSHLIFSHYQYPCSVCVCVDGVKVSKDSSYDYLFCKSNLIFVSNISIHITWHLWQKKFFLNKIK